MQFDLDVTAGPSDEELHWPDDGDITKTWFVVKRTLGEHNRRLTEHDGRLDETERRHEQIDTWVVQHEEIHGNLAMALNAIHGDLQQQKAIAKVHMEVVGKTYLEIQAQQGAAATRSNNHHAETLAAMKFYAEQDQKRRDHRTIWVIGAIIATALLITVLRWALTR